ncbi:MFS transporter [Pseudofrankia asymbiotica]|uniref:MFS transporter n=1 Tax=Pseudofrankia asymbiotica TaxID=1834516 RepID=UPI001F517270|nr:MFS transporter [Pseudofrankia asymbiotica]
MPAAASAAFGEESAPPPLPAAAGRWSVAVAFALFVVIGVASGVAGVLLPAQIADYGVDEATIGITFFTSAAGYVVASVLSGALVGRAGTRRALLVAGLLLLGAWLATAARPPFAAFVLLSLLSGFGMGAIDCVLNIYLATRPGATSLLNRLHAFFGVHSGVCRGRPLTLGFVLRGRAVIVA